MPYSLSLRHLSKENQAPLFTSLKIHINNLAHKFNLKENIILNLIKIY